MSKSVQEMFDGSSAIVKTAVMGLLRSNLTDVELMVGHSGSRLVIVAEADGAIMGTLQQAAAEAQITSPNVGETRVQVEAQPATGDEYKPGGLTGGPVS